MEKRMKRAIIFILTVAMLGLMSVTAYAEETEIDVHVERITKITGKYTEGLVGGSGSIFTDTGVEIYVSDAPDHAKQLVVIPVPEDSKAELWLEDCTVGEGLLVHAWAIYFEDADGNKIPANGVLVTISGLQPDADMQIYAVSIDGTAEQLDAVVQNGTISFTANGNEYYLVTSLSCEDPEDKVFIEVPTGGRVEVSDENPEAGDTVIITVTPDEGNEVDVVIVRDENGNELPVTDDGDGTYSYEQPEGTVIITVTFREKESEEEPPHPSWKDWLKKIFGKWWGYDEKCEHSYTSVVTDPTCENKGYTTYTCSKCGDSYKDSYTDALGHAWDDGEVTKEATCTENGTKTFTCETCGTTKTEAVKAHGHEFEDGICTECGEEKTPDKPCKPSWGSIWDWIFRWWN